MAAGGVVSGGCGGGFLVGFGGCEVGAGFGEGLGGCGGFVGG